MIAHLSTYATDFPTTKAFYEAVLSGLGYSVQFELAFEDEPDLPGRRACAFGPEGTPTFWVIETLVGNGLQQGVDLQDLQNAIPLLFRLEPGGIGFVFPETPDDLNVYLADASSNSARLVSRLRCS